MDHELRIRDAGSSPDSLFVIHDSARVGWRVAIGAIVVFFAAGTSVLSWDNARSDLASRFHWPDETTNNFFVQRVVRGEPLAVAEPRNIVAGDIIHPRTANVRGDGAIVPGAYLGLPLWYGMIGRVLGERAVLFITPILAALGLLAFASIIRRFAGATVAVLATTLLTLHPSLWFFTATALLPNVPFVALLLLGFVVLARADSRQPQAASPHPSTSPLPKGSGETKEDFSPSRLEGEREGVGLSVVRWSLGGLLLGLALTIRTHELLWVGTMLAVFAWRSHKQQATSNKQSFRAACSLQLAACSFGLILPFIPILVLNVQIYGSPFTTGYALLQENGSAPTEFVASVLPGWLAALVAPFGWHPVEALARFWKYTIVPYPWFSGFVAVGFAVALARSAVLKFKVQSSKFKTNSNDKFSKLESRNSIWALDLGFWTSVKMTVGSIILMVWLILYYGSWELADSLVRETNVLTISYARYWLPVTIALAPWAALGFRWVLDRCAARWRPVIAVFVFLGIASTSFTQVVTNPTEGLLRQRAALAEHRARARAVIAATEPGAVIVSHRMDKVFFPERAVVHVPEDPVTDLDILRRLRVIADVAPTYWYTASRPSLSGFTFIANDDMPFGEQLYRVRAL